MDPNSFAQPEVALVTRLNLDWTLDFSAKVITGSATVHVRRVQEDARHLILDTRDLVITGVSSAGVELPYALGERHPKYGAPLTVTLAEDPPKDENVVISYSTSPSSTALQWLDPGQTAGGEQAYVFSQCQAIHCRSLAPLQDTPGVKCPYTATVRCPAALTALMSAVKTHESTLENGLNMYKFEQDMPIPSYLIAVVCGQIESRTLGARTKVWSEPSVVDKAAYEFAETEKMLSVTEDFCGPYQWKIYELVVLPPSFPYGGMENPCLTFVTPTLLSGDRSSVDVVIHEITHSWTGNLVTSCKWGDFWLNEGFTMFIERKILGILHGQPTRHFSAMEGWKSLGDCITNAFPAGDPLTALVPDLAGVDPDDAFSSVPYEKGHTLLWYLEQMLGGSDVFDPFLRAYIARFSRQSIKTEQFLEFLKEHFVDQKEKLDTIDWDSWLYKPGMPPYTPKFDEQLGAVCGDLVTKWVEWTEDQPFPGSAEDLDNLTSKQVIEFLERLYIEKDPLPLFKLKKMEEIYSLFEKKNCDIKFRWLRICIRSRWEKAVQPALQLVTVQGRMKFVRPIYRELYKWEGEVRQQTIAHFESVQGGMMHVAAHTVRQDLGLDNN